MNTHRLNNVAKLYANGNVALPLVDRLRSLGHDVLTSHEAGTANRCVSDADVLMFAFARQRLVLTNNRRDFLTLNRQGLAHAGIVVFTFDMQFDALADRIHTGLQVAEERERPLVRVTKTIVDVS